jgi:hypothetical protein
MTDLRRCLHAPVTYDGTMRVRAVSCDGGANS